jgi:hypothetical protein
MRLKQYLKRTAVTEQGAPTLKFSTILFSSPEFLTKLADVKIIVDPFHSIKKPVHAKNLFLPAYDDCGY